MDVVDLRPVHWKQSQLGSLLDFADLQFGRILLQHGLVVVLR